MSAPVLTIRLFARFAELFGGDTVTLDGSGVRTVGDVLARLRALPAGSALGSSVLVAVNLKQVRHDAPVAPGDEVAILPPLAGG